MIVLTFFHALAATEVVHLLHQLGESGWAIKTALHERVLVGIDYSFDALNLWCIDVSVQGEAVRNCISARFLTAESIDWELLVVVIVLENRKYRLDCSEVLVPIFIPVMQRIWRILLTV